MNCLALTVHVGYQSRGTPVGVTIDNQNRLHFERGRDIFYTRMGQMNLACTHCHDRNFGRKLLNDTVSQGHGNPYPAYRVGMADAGLAAPSVARLFFWCARRIAAGRLPGFA